MNAEAEAAFSARVGDTATASLDAGLRAGGEASFRAALPVDLFDMAGIVAQAAVGVFASAHLRLNVSLEADAFADKLRSSLGPPLNGPPLDAFLESTRVYAGAFAEVHAAAMAHAEFVVGGSLLKTSSRPAGFSATLNYGAAFGLGGGYQFAAGFEIGDPVALVDGVTAALIEELNTLVMATGPEQAAVALKVLLPIASRTALVVSQALLDNPSSVDVASVGRTMAEAMRTALLPLIMDAATEIAVRTIQSGLAQVAPRFAIASADDLKEALGTIGEAQDRLVALPPEPSASDVADVVVATLDAVRSALSLLDMDQQVHDLRTVLGAGTASVVLIGHLADPEQNPADYLPAGLTALLPAAPTDLPGLIGVVLSELNLTSSPVVGELLDWASKLAGTDPAHLLSDLLQDLLGNGPASWDEAALAARARAMVAGISDVADTLIADALVPVRDDPAGKVVVDVLVEPLLAVFLSVLSDGIDPHAPSDAAAAVRLREQLSAVLLQQLSRFLVEGVDILLAHSLVEGRLAMAALAAELRKDSPGEEAEELAVAALVVLAQFALFGAAVDTETLAKLLDFADRFLEAANDDVRPAAKGFVTEALRLAADQAGWPKLKEIGTHEGGLPVKAPQQLTEKMFNDLGSLVRDSTDDLLLIVADILVLGRARIVVELVVKAAEAVYEGLKQGYEWARDKANDLQQLADALVKSAAAVAGRVAGAVAGLAQRAMEIWQAVLDAIVDGIAMPLLAPVLPDFSETTVRVALQGVVNAVGSPASWLLSVIEAGFSWAAEQLRAVAEGRVTTGSMADHLSGWLATNVKDVPLTVLGFTITLPAHDLALVVSREVLRQFGAELGAAERQAQDAATELIQAAALRVASDVHGGDADAMFTHVEATRVRDAAAVSVSVEISGGEDASSTTPRLQALAEPTPMPMREKKGGRTSVTRQASEPKMHAPLDVVTVTLRGGPERFLETQLVIDTGAVTWSPPAEQWDKRPNGDLVWRGAIRAVTPSIRSTSLIPRLPEPAPFQLARAARRPPPSAIVAGQHPEWLPRRWSGLEITNWAEMRGPDAIDAHPQRGVPGTSGDVTIADPVVRRIDDRVGITGENVRIAPRACGFPAGRQALPIRVPNITAERGPTPVAGFAARVDQLIEAGVSSETLEGITRDGWAIVDPDTLAHQSINTSGITEVLPLLDVPVGVACVTAAFSDGAGVTPDSGFVSLLLRDPAYEAAGYGLRSMSQEMGAGG